MSMYIAQIGQNYGSSVFSEEGIGKTSLVLSHNNLSGAGKNYTLTSKRTISFTIPLYSISSISLECSSAYILLILSCFGFAASFWNLTSGVASGIIFLILYLFSIHRYIVINVHGCCYALSLRGIANREVDTFIGQTMWQMKLCPLSVHIHTQEVDSTTPSEMNKNHYEETQPNPSA